VQEWFGEAIEREAATEWIVTTRIDNDDALHHEAVADVQRNVRPGTTEFLCFPFGYTRHDSSGEAMQRETRTNAFLSFVEKRETQGLRTVLRFNCGHTEGIAPMRRISSEPRWLQVVHERNLLNAMKGAPTAPIDLDADFTVGASGQALVRRLLGSAAARP
jgi:hypothetical protein